MIWQYDSTKRAWSKQPLPISAVCARKGYYSEEDEADLARLIEGPANPHIEAIRGGSRG